MNTSTTLCRLNIQLELSQEQAVSVFVRYLETEPQEDLTKMSHPRYKTLVRDFIAYKGTQFCLKELTAEQEIRKIDVKAALRGIWNKG